MQTEKEELLELFKLSERLKKSVEKLNKEAEKITEKINVIKGC